jgi:large subunit ribosomal protein L17
MRHRKDDKKLGRTGAHRKALVASLVCGLIQEKRIHTTLPKAKIARRAAEKMVTLARHNTVAARREAVAKLRRKHCVRELFDTIAPQYQGRNGGYTRIVRLGARSGDGAEMAMLEWVHAARSEADTEDEAARK